jgi:TolB-like protein/Tfp pilus assembly protein PilF
MASLIPGYEYDIFISYRQKDNKHDGWVTEFVNQLKGELEATFKEDISIYFDENPHDGLLEVHSVDKSLESKLKCLIFIPIISQTYCDPKSFAWQHEFCTFNKLAREDRFGRDIKLTSGNVASRILPVKIHDLDPEDKELLENELVGVLRSIEFIYKSAGVNRPLRANEDHPQDNLNKTYYRDQINKVANAIKEIFTALKKQSLHPEEASKEDIIVKSISQKNQRAKIIAGILIILALIALGYFIVSKSLRPKEQIEKSIAVLPFKLLSDEPDKQYLADGMMDAITLHLSKIKDLRVLGRTSTEQYRNPTKTLTAIGKDLDVSYLLEGSFQKFGDSVRLIVQLIKTGKEGHEWANNYDRSWKNVFSVQSEVAKAIARELQAVITPEEKELIEKVPTTNLTAYDFYQRGREEHINYMNISFMEYTENWGVLKNAENYYRKALEYDSTFALAYSGLALIYNEKHTYSTDTYFSENYLDSTKILADRALALDDKLAEAYDARGIYYGMKGISKQAIEEYNKALRYNPNDWMAYTGKGSLYMDNDLVQAIINFQKAVSLIRESKQLPSLLRNIGFCYGFAGFDEKAKSYNIEALKLDNDSLQFYLYAEIDEFYSSNYEKAIEYLRKGYAIDSTHISVLEDLGFDYLFVGRFDESLKYYKKYIEKLKARGQFKYNGTHRIGYSYWKNGYKKEAQFFFDNQIEYCNSAIQYGRQYAIQKYAYYDLAGIYAFLGDKDQAFKNLRVFNERQMLPSWAVWYSKNDPLFDSIRNEPEFQQIVSDVEAKYQAEHERVRKWLEEQGML